MSGYPAHEELVRACAALPIYPLPRAVLLPHTILPLHVFEERYRALVRRALDGDRLLAIPTLAPGWEDGYAGQPAVHPVAGLGCIVQHRALHDGRYNIAVLGVGRVRIEDELPRQDGYRVVRAALLDDDLPGDQQAQLRTRLEEIRALLGQLLLLYPRLRDELWHILEAPRLTPALLDPLAHMLLQEFEDRRLYLEEDRPLARAECVLEGLAGVIARASPDMPEA